VSHVPLVSELVGRASAGDVVSWQSGTEEATEGEIREAIARAQQADRVIVLTYTRGVLPAGQVELVKALLATERPLAAVATGTPYDIVHYPDAKAYVACYAHSFVPAHLASPSVLEAAIRVLFGAHPTGKLPVQISKQYPLGYGIGY
jgi:beta-N-acetylhexosaminidase